ncbi:sensor histidine kinase [Nannocystaceae bacterium ST9]
MSAERTRLVARVARVGAVAAAFAGMLAAALAGLLAAELVGLYAEQSLRADAFELSAEISEELRGEADDDADDDEFERNADGTPVLAGVLAHELEDVEHPGASALIVERSGARSIGDASLPSLEIGECRLIDMFDQPRRVCAVGLGDDTLVLGISAQDEHDRLQLLVWALIAGGLIGAALGGAASLWAARWALAPLDHLRDRVRQIDADAPRSSDLALAQHDARYEEIDELRVAIAALIDRLAASLAQAQSFAAQAAHELRTPLTVLAGELELLGEDSSHDRKAIERLRGRVHALGQLIQRLLVLANPGTVTRLGGEAVDLADVVDLARADLEPSAAERVHVRCEDDLLVRGDPELIRAMLANAIENALKFSREPVEIVATAQATEIWIEVIDRGPGIPRELRDQVFAAFYRSPDARAGTPGHGIGLALIRHVAEVHRGRCEFVDQPRGARLRIHLPRWTARG